MALRRRDGRGWSGPGLVEHADQLAPDPLGRALLGAEPDPQCLAAVPAEVGHHLEAGDVSGSLISRRQALRLSGLASR